MRRSVGHLARLGVLLALSLVASGCTQLGIETGPQIADPVLVPVPPAPPAAPTPGAPAPAPPAAPAAPTAPAAPATQVVFAARSGRWFADWRMIRADLTEKKVTWEGPKIAKGARLTVGDEVAVAVKGTSLVVADLATGEERYRKTLTGPADNNCSTSRDEPIIDVERPCVTVVAGVVAVRMADAVVGYDARSGEERWRSPVSKAYGPLSGGAVVGTLYRLNDDSPQLLLIDAPTGTPKQVPLTCPPGPGRPKETVATQALLHPTGATVTFGTGSASGCMRQLELPSLADRFILNGGSTPGVTGLGELSLHGSLVVRPFNPTGGKAAGVTIITPDGQPRIVPYTGDQTTTEVGNSDGASVEIVVQERADPTRKSLMLGELGTGRTMWSLPLENVKHIALNPGMVMLRCPFPAQCNVTAVDRASGKGLEPVDLPPNVDSLVLTGPTQLVFGGKQTLAVVDPKDAKVLSSFTYEG